MSILQLAIVLDVRRHKEIALSITYMMTVMIMVYGIAKINYCIEGGLAFPDATDGIMESFRTIRRKKMALLPVEQIQIDTNPIQCSGGMNVLDQIVITT